MVHGEHGKEVQFLQTLYQGQFLKNNINIKPGDVCTFYYTNLGRVGHVEIIYKADDKYVYTISGNTNGVGSREGDGCYRKKRELSKVYAITRYIKWYDIFS